MKRILVLFVAAVLATTAFVPGAVAQEPGTPVPDADFWRLANYVVAADTLWFTAAAPLDNYADEHNATDWYPPEKVPIGTNNSGDLIMKTRRVRNIRLSNRTPFSFLAHYATGDSSVGGGDTEAIYCLVDTTAWQGSASGWGLDQACWIVIGGFPDSLKIKTAADSVRVELGY